MVLPLSFLGYHRDMDTAREREEEIVRFLLWFLNSPNSYLPDQQKPVELLGKDDERIVSLAKAALHPADVF